MYVCYDKRLWVGVGCVREWVGMGCVCLHAHAMRKWQGGTEAHLGGEEQALGQVVQGQQVLVIFVEYTIEVTP